MGCNESNRRPDPATEAAEAPLSANPPTEAEADPGDISDETWARLTGHVCSFYADWPVTLWRPTTSDSLGATLEGLNPEQRARFDATDMAERALAACPDAISVEIRASTGRFPRPAERLAQLSGFYNYEQAQGADEDAARYAMTAVGLGCLGLGETPDTELGEREVQLLSAMGYTRDSYVAASLAANDPEMSDRIFRTILGCAQRSGASGDR